MQSCYHLNSHTYVDQVIDIQFAQTPNLQGHVHDLLDKNCKTHKLDEKTHEN